MFVLAFDNTNNGDKKVERNSHTKYFLPRVLYNNCNALIGDRNFYDQQINDQIKRFDKIRKTVTSMDMITQLDVCYIISISKILPINCSRS